jgi:asparagine synthase (glutamine-hydrolysing)
MVACQVHRGPDAAGTWSSPDRLAALGHRRLSILDLSDAGRQPMASHDGRYTIVFNGEIYNYLELREELGGSTAFRTRTDTEVLLAAYARWGDRCLDRLIGMFSFALWDDQSKRLFAARDRFGVKPLYFHQPAGGGVWLASEIKAFHAASVPSEPDRETWATYMSSGCYDHDGATFWSRIRQVPPGASLTWDAERGLAIRTWYDPADAVLRQGTDTRDEATVRDELLHLLEHSVRLRFRSDVPVGICLSGGLDSSLLLGLVRRIYGAESEVKAFTFFCDDPRYDETPWVQQMLAQSRHPSHFCRLSIDEVPELAARVQSFQDEPYGGVPTLGMAQVHARARREGVTVLLDGSGLDEGWAGYEYYARSQEVDPALGPVQGSRSPAVRRDCLRPEFEALARPVAPPRRFDDALRTLQYRDLCQTKIPRALRFSDRVSMMHSRELREPFLDHRILELGLRQPVDRKIRHGQGKWLLRQIAAQLLPAGVCEAPKRPVQTPQREWLRGPLSGWAERCIEASLSGPGKEWLDPVAVRSTWREYLSGSGDNSFHVWQWISLGLMTEAKEASR